MPKKCGFEVSILVSTKTLLLKHYYFHQSNFSNIQPEFVPENAPNFPRNHRGFSCFVSSWGSETTGNSPRAPAIFQCQIPGEFKKKLSKVFWRAGKGNSCSPLGVLLSCVIVCQDLPGPTLWQEFADLEPGQASAQLARLVVVDSGIA